MREGGESAARSGKERRRAPRFVARCRARTWAADHWLEVQVVNLSRLGIWVTSPPGVTVQQPVTLLLSPLEGGYQVAVRGHVLRVDDRGARVQFAEGQSDIGPWIRRMICAEIMPQVEERLRREELDPETLSRALAIEQELVSAGATASMELSVEETDAIGRFRVALAAVLVRIDPALRARAAELSVESDDGLDFDIDIVDKPAAP